MAAAPREKKSGRVGLLEHHSPAAADPPSTWRWIFGGGRKWRGLKWCGARRRTKPAGGGGGRPAEKWMAVCPSVHLQRQQRLEQGRSSAQAAVLQHVPRAGALHTFTPENCGGVALLKGEPLASSHRARLANPGGAALPSRASEWSRSSSSKEPGAARAATSERREAPAACRRGSARAGQWGMLCRRACHA